MFLKELSIKGFKSFADPALLELEPGITVVVGPNGSGKSNVVDAMAWVLGAQAPTSVRSQKMDDVIFAGTTSKKALGRAEVSLTIDNGDGQLLIDFNEVTITRTLFRSGDSDYAINGVSCRLLDIQELLSDSGVGRQQHIIISQGRIDDVLNAKPEDRRSIIEEAAGVLKYRKRKERAERRLAATEENLHRLQDLLREVRRQVRPLEKQADAARRHGEVTTELYGLKVFLAGQELRSLNDRMAAAKRQRRDLNERGDRITTTLATLDAAIIEGETELASLGASDVADVASRARSLRERTRGQHNVLAERRRRLEGELQSAVDDGLVANLEAESARMAGELRAAEAEARSLVPEFARLEETESHLSNEQLTFDTEWDDELGPKPTRAPEMRAQLEALTEAIARAGAELDRLDTELAAIDDRRTRARTDRATAAETLDRVEAERPSAERAVVEATTVAADTEAVVASTAERRREADAEASRWQARADALRQALDDARSRAGAAALAEADGVLGALLDLVDIDDGWELAVEAAAGEALRAVVIDNPANASAALATLEDQDLAGAVLSLGRPRPAALAPPSVGHALRHRVRAVRPDVEALLDALFFSAVVVDGDWRQAVDVAMSHPDRVVVTKAGDRFGSAGWRIGLTGTGATGAALAEAESTATVAVDHAETVGAEMAAATTAAAEGARALRQAEERLRGLVNEQERAAQGRDRAAATLTQLDDDRHRLEQRRHDLAQQHGADEAVADKLRAELPAVENDEAEYLNRVEALSLSRASLEQRGRAVGRARKDLEVRAAAIEQRRTLLQNRQAETEQRLARLVVERDQARVRRETIENAMADVDALRSRLETRTATLDGWIALLGEEQRAQSEAARQASSALTARRTERQGAERELVEVRERRSRLELDETEFRVKLGALTEALRRELDTEPDVAMAAVQPEIEGGAAPAARVRDLERELKLMGPINPLALDEFEALKERHEFLAGQLDDVKTTRRDLNTLIRSIDEEIVSVFAAAYADVATNFVDLFATLFPGGRGGVKLTNPDDILNCGIEIEAKPSGKNVKKLSLLSGGERSLVALAFLFAVFRSRPSPFYVMDEVEAALDDINLSRFLALIEEFRKEAQLIVVTHQKRTMEAADVLYGVTMKPGGSSKVVSEKVEGRRAGDEPMPLDSYEPAAMDEAPDDETPDDDLGIVGETDDSSAA
ncbi:MAG: chromosome segregation protein SMC [Acidimicrobiales bacterium]